MDSTISSPAPEQKPQAPEATETSLSPESLEARPATTEAAVNQPKADDGVASAQQTVASVTADDQAVSDDAATTTPVTPAPAAPSQAGDQDVIEPEWVNKAQAIVQKYREDPRAEEAAVEDLQVEYMQKRYGIEVKPGDDKS